MNKFLLTLFLLIGVSTSAVQAQIIGGIGAQLFLDTTGSFSMPRIQSLVPGSPAYDSLKATDYIIKVNDMDCRNKTMEEVVGQIRGEAGTGVKIVVADTKEGKRPRVYELHRVSIQTGAGPDIVTSFNTDCENEARQLKKKRLTIIKSVSSDCGNYFFNFDAETEPCHIKVMALEEKGTGAFNPGFTISANVSEGGNTAEALDLTTSAPKVTGNMYITRIDRDIILKRPNVCTIAVRINGDIKKCKGMYVLVYSDKTW